jgi:glycosyltransferase involved in cell wall biosynthesis
MQDHLGEGRAGPRVVMLLENNPYPADVRVRQEATSLARAGYEVKVIAPRSRGQARSEMLDGVVVSRYASPAMPPTTIGYVAEYAIATVQLLGRAIAELGRGASVLHIHNPPDTLFPVAFVARILGRKVVYDHHDLAPELFRVKFGNDRVARALELLERATFRLADAVLAPNASHRRIAIERGGVDPRRVHIVRNGPRRSEIVSGVDVRPGSLIDPRLIFVGSMESQDGIEQVPRLLEVLLRDHGLCDAHLAMVGDGSMREAVEREFARLGLSAHVSFTGYVSPDRVDELISGADIGIDPAPPNQLNDHSTMIKVLEYMARGRPVVAYALHETRETAGEAARLVDSGEVRALARAIATVAADERLRRRMAAQGLRRATRLSWEHSAAELLETYASLNAGRRSV